ncbi:MAG: DNA gyrase subunit A, partial [Nitrosopumilaceae archaeon]
MASSGYIEQERRDYALYTLQSRAIPALADGLKSAARRVLWIARDGKKYKTTTLAGATMPIHPHGPPEGTINTLAAPYGNNIPLLDGDGTFGTLLNPTACGAGRYTSVKVSKFTEDVIFRDIEIIPMMDNYDGSLQEPIHFLPLIPVVLLNPQEGIAVGFACNILSHAFEDIVASQIQYLRGKKVEDIAPFFTPFRARALKGEPDKNSSTKWLFHGQYSIKDTS